MPSAKFVFILFSLFSFSVYAQSVVINEVMSSNTSQMSDEDDQHSDWIELYNRSSSIVNLKGFGLTDDKDQLYKWIFPETFLTPNSFMYVFASGKDRKPLTGFSAVHWETIIDWGDNWKYFSETTEPPAGWRTLDFNDSTWLTGPSGFGYGDNNDSTIVSPRISLQIRHSFEIQDINDITAGMLHVDYDDAFVAYLNGVEIARANIGQAGVEPSYSQLAILDKEPKIYYGGLPEYFEIKNLLQILRTGKNVLAVEVHNKTAGGSDLTLIPFLTLGMNKIPANPRGIDSLVSHSFKDLHTNFQINANGEKIYLTNSSGECIDTSLSVYIPADVSYGRKPDGSGNWVYFSEPSAGATNNNSKEYTSLSDSVITSHNGGFYNSSLTLSLSANSADAKIYYTLDGSDPTLNSFLYTTPILIDSTHVLRARTYEENKLPGLVKTITFLINEKLTLPVLSVTTDPLNLWDENSGIYVYGNNYDQSYPYRGANFWQDWEKPANLEFFEADGRNVLNQGIGLKIFGTWSRVHPQRSLQLLTKSRYGKSKFKYKIFPDLDIEEYSSFILRNGGNDFASALIRDEVIQRTIRDMTDIDNEEYRPVDVFLNGKYWGIYCTREKISEDYIASHHNVNPDSVSILEFIPDGSEIQVIKGSAEHYTNMLNYISTNSVISDKDYEYIKTQMDIDEFIDYTITEIYFDNRDWPGNNIKFWRANEPGSRWRWILFGAEFSLGIYGNPSNYNSLEDATAENGGGFQNQPWATYLLRKLLENENFKNEFLRRFADHLNVTFKPERIKNIVSKLKTEIETDMPRNIERWSYRWDQKNQEGYTKYDDWIDNVNVLNNFVQERPQYVWNHIVQKFALKGVTAINFKVFPLGSGKLKVNRLYIPGENWTGTYFRNVPITISAIPQPGYKFKNWSGASTSSNATITLNFSTFQNLRANFEIEKVDTNRITINEINYNSAKDHDSEDWIELFNNNDSTIAIGGWKIKGSDSTNIFVIPENTVLDPLAYLVICRDKVKFSGFSPDVKNVIGDLGFGFSGSGETIEFCDPNDKLVDKVKYNDKLPWPIEPDGNGFTLELKNPNLDNSLAENWVSSKVKYGTPGIKNSSILVDVKEPAEKDIPLTYKLEQNYPNPFNPTTRIRYSLPNSGNVKISVFDVLGRELLVLVNEVKKAGNYELDFNAHSLSSGVYFYSMITTNFSSTKKLIVAK